MLDGIDPVTVAVLVLAAGFLLGLAALPKLLLQRRESTATLAWLLAIVFVPYVGLLLFWLFGTIRFRRRVRRKSRAHRDLAQAMDRAASDVLASFRRDEIGDAYGVLEAGMRLADRLVGAPATTGNQVELLVDGDATYDAMERAIEAATDHVHFQFYVFRTDASGRRFRDLLARKARQGVAVRLLYDDAGSLSISEEFLEPLTSAGGRAAAFLPVNALLRRVNVTLRNHRKIVVVDGRIGFVGGINIGDEYRGTGRRRERWRDTHARIEGPAVHRLQEVFAEDWYFTTGEDIVVRRYLPDQRPSGGEVVQVVPSGPDLRWETIHRILFTVVTAAERSVLLTTPYFVPDQALQVALETAALRGIEVRLLLPERSDHPLLDRTARSFLPELLRAGVRVFAYGPGTMHAKTAVVDGVWSTVGSANMDVRSFRLNFEANLVIYGRSFAERLTRVIEDDLRHAREVTAIDLGRRSYRERVVDGACRVLAPVL